MVTNLVNGILGSTPFPTDIGAVVDAFDLQHFAEMIAPFFERIQHAMNTTTEA